MSRSRRISTRHKDHQVKTTQPLATFVMHFGKECIEGMEKCSPSCRDFEEAEKKNFLIFSLPFLLLNGSLCGPPRVRARTKVQPPLIQTRGKETDWLVLTSHCNQEGNQQETSHAHICSVFQVWSYFTDCSDVYKLRSYNLCLIAHIKFPGLK